MAQDEVDTAPPADSETKEEVADASSKAASVEHADPPSEAAAGNGEIAAGEDAPARKKTFMEIIQGFPTSSSAIFCIFPLMSGKIVWFCCATVALALLYVAVEMLEQSDWRQNLRKEVEEKQRQLDAAAGKRAKKEEKEKDRKAKKKD